MNGFDPDRIAMLGAGSGLVVGSVTIEGEPHAVRAWSAEVLERRPLRLRLAVSADAPETVPSLDGRPVALTAADVRTVDSFQLKGTGVAMGPPDEHDRSVIAEQSEAFLRAIEETDGDPVDQLRRLLPNVIEMVELVATEMYDQTPGPHAGDALGAPA